MNKLKIVSSAHNTRIYEKLILALNLPNLVLTDVDTEANLLLADPPEIGNLHTYLRKITIYTLMLPLNIIGVPTNHWHECLHSRILVHYSEKTSRLCESCNAASNGKPSCWSTRTLETCIHVVDGRRNGNILSSEFLKS